MPFFICQKESERLTNLIADINHVVSTHLLDILSLVLAVCKGPDFSTKSLGEHHGIVTQSTNSNDANFLSGATAVSDEGREDSKAGTKHGGGVLGGKTRWNRENELLVSTDGGGVSVEVE